MTSLADITTSPPAPRQHYSLTFGALALGAATFAILQSLVAPALPDIQRELHASPTAVAWVLTGYLLSASVLTPIVGRLGDMFGKERTLVVSLAILAAGSLLAALATSIEVLILARVIQGCGGAIFPLSFGIIRDEFPRERVATGIAMISSILGIGAGLGIVLAGPIVEALSYHWLFWIPFFLTVVATIATVFFVPESPVKVPGKVNWLGAFLLLPSTLGMLVVGPLAGRLANRVGARVPLVLGSLTTCVAFGFLGVAHTNPWEFYAGSALLGIGIGLAFASLANLIVVAVRPDQTGVATGMNTVMRTVGGSVGAQIGASVLAATVIGSALPTEHGYTIAFAFASAACGLATIASLAVPPPRRRRGRSRMKRGDMQPREHASFERPHAVVGADEERG